MSYKDILKLTECQTSTSNPLPENIPISNPRLMTDLRIQRSALSSERQEIFKQVKELHKNGISMRSIAEMLSLHRQTVKRYISVEELTSNRGQVTNNYASHLDRIQQGYTNGESLKTVFLEIKKMGFEGSMTSIYNRFGKFFKERSETHVNQVAFQALTCKTLEISVRRLTMLSTGALNMEEVKKHEKDAAILLFRKCALVRKLRLLVLGMKYFFQSKNLSHFERWINMSKSINSKKIDSFINGIKQDYDAVKNAITTPYSNGVVEGNVNRLKTIKRQMYGRASFELLRRKLVLSVTG